MNKDRANSGWRRMAIRLPLAMALAGAVMTMQGCSVAHKSWDATKQASSSVAKAVWPGSDTAGQSLSFEYQWQLMTPDVKRKAGADLTNGDAVIDEPGFAGRAACMMLNPTSVDFDTGRDGDGAGPVSRLEASGFQVQQVGTLETNRQCSPGPGIVPDKVTVYTDKRLVVGQIVGGRALVQVGDRVFDTQGLYFRFRVNSIDLQTRIVSGQFEFMAQNQQNPDTRETLFVANAAFTAKL